MNFQSFPALTALVLLSTLGGCQGGSGSENTAAEAATATADGAMAKTEVIVTTADGQAHRFTVDVAANEAQQQQGLMYRTTIPVDGGMLFSPYPVDGGPPKIASFWMRNTPSPLDILFVRANGTVASIAENTIPFSETPVGSGEPVAAVLEIAGGRAAELGIAAGDKVTWK